MDTSGTVCALPGAGTSRTRTAVETQRRPGNARLSRAKISLFALAPIILLLLTAFIGQATAQTVATDKTDYGSGEVAVITGSGWVPGEVVVFAVTQDPMLYSTDSVHTTADLDGNIRSGYLVPGLDVPQLFTLTATGAASGPAAPLTFTNSLNFVSLVPPTTPTALVQTDKSDYSPGETAVITGAGWLAGETVNLEIVEDILSHPSEKLHAITDNAGIIVAGYVVDAHDLGRTFILTATGQTSGLTAQTTFTDAPTSCPGNHTPDATCLLTSGCVVGCRQNITQVCHPTATQTLVAGTVCRASTGACDPQEVCDGSSAACPANGFASAGTACGGNEAACDALDTCNGSGACVDNVKAAGAICLTGTGVCDPNDVCDGSTTTCTAVYASTGAACGGSEAACDALDTCNGSGACVDNVKAAGVVCLTGTGVCDPADVCDGTTTLCAPVYALVNTACGGSDAACDALDTCNGSGSCTDNVKASGFVCNPAGANSTCDPADVCDGTTTLCAPVYAANTVSCTGTSNGGACDATDHCSGTGTCVDEYRLATYVCRADAGQCDVEEKCTGTSGACPDDVFTSCSQVTSSSLCPIPDDTFRLIYLQDPVLVNNVYNYNNFRLNASNPGQFYYNVFYTGGSFPLTIDIPYPFVTQGSVPIQVHSTTPPPDGACWNPGSLWSDCTIATAGSTASGIYSPSGDPIIRLDDYIPKNIDSVTQIAVNCTAVPASGVYVSVHLDYGLKKSTGWQQVDSVLDTNTIVNDAVNGAVTILDGEEYEFLFSDSTTDPVDAHLVFSNNAFKKNPGVAGLTLQSDSANPKGNIYVQLLNSSGSVVGTTTTDADGFYQIFYKHTGKAANYTVNLPDLKVKQVVQLKANGFAAVLFENLP
jgi:hypothetical protein